MQIEPPETIHFPIHSLQELQEQRGGLRVSALGSAAPIGARGVLDLVQHGNGKRIARSCSSVLSRSCLTSFLLALLVCVPPTILLLLLVVAHVRALLLLLLLLT